MNGPATGRFETVDPASVAVPQSWSKLEMTMLGLIQGKESLLIRGSRISIAGFAGSSDGMPHSPILESRGIANWRVTLTGMVPNPVSEKGDGRSVDFGAELLSEDGPLVCIGDDLVVSISLDAGEVLGVGQTHFTGKESLDFLGFIPAPDSSAFAVLSTRRLTVFRADGGTAYETGLPGLARSARWTSPLQLIVTSHDLNSLEEGCLESRIDLSPPSSPSSPGLH